MNTGLILSGVLLFSGFLFVCLFVVILVSCPSLPSALLDTGFLRISQGNNQDVMSLVWLGLRSDPTISPGKSHQQVFSLGL